MAFWSRSMMLSRHAGDAAVCRSAWAAAGTAMSAAGPLAGAGSSRAFNSGPVLEEWPGIPALKPAANLPSPTTQVTTLPNGLRVASEETYGQVACITMCIDSGSRCETEETHGVNHFLETLAFKSTKKRSAEQMQKDAVENGIQPSSMVSREHAIMRVDCLRESLETAVEMLADAVTNDEFSDADVEDAKRVVEYQNLDVGMNPQLLVQEALHAAAFGETSALGRPLNCPADRVQAMTAQKLGQYVKEHYTGRRMVLAGIGVDHDRLVRYAERYLSDIPAGEEYRPLPSSPYIGGDVRLVLPPSPAPMMKPLTHMAIAFPVIGGWNSDEVVADCVLDTLLGGGSSFSIGGPGKGMYSRLFLEVLNQYMWVESAAAFSIHMSDVGLSGLYGAAEPAAADKLAFLLVSQLLALAEKPVSEEELSRARNQLRSSIMMNLEMRYVLCEDIGRQILLSNKRVPPAELCEQIAAVTADDLQLLAQRMLEHVPSVAILGDDQNRMPQAADIAHVFKSRLG